MVNSWNMMNSKNLLAATDIAFILTYLLWDALDPVRITYMAALAICVQVISFAAAIIFICKIYKQTRYWALILYAILTFITFFYSIIICILVSVLSYWAAVNQNIAITILSFIYILLNITKLTLDGLTLVVVFNVNTPPRRVEVL